jgi:hypothetical protein
MLDFIGQKLARVIAEAMALDRWAIDHIGTSVDAVIAPAMQRGFRRGQRLLTSFQQHKRLKQRESAK